MASLQSMRQKIVEKINLILDQKYGADSPFRRLIRPYFENKGKKLRPLLCANTYLLFADESNLDLVYPLAAAIEITHNASLIIDDVFDRDIRRRGDAAFYVKHGTFAALSVSYALSAFVLELSSKTGNIAVIQEISRMGGELSYSVYLSRNLRSNYVIGKKRSMEILYLKTASLFRAATKSAALLANVSEEHVENMRKFGEAYGIAYQLRDDALAILNDVEKIGKGGESDILNRLQTIIFLEALERASPSEKEILKQYYLKNADYDVELIRDILISSGGVQAVIDLAADYLREARDILDLYSDSLARAHLYQLLDVIELDTLSNRIIS